VIRAGGGGGGGGGWRRLAAAKKQARRARSSGPRLSRIIRLRCVSVAEAADIKPPAPRWHVVVVFAQFLV